MQKSFILALGVFVIAAFLFIFSGQNTTEEEVSTSFEVSQGGGITVNNGVTGESFVITDDNIKEKTVANIEPASGDAQLSVIDAKTTNGVAADVDAVLAIEDDVINMTEKAKTAESINLNVGGMNIAIEDDEIENDEEGSIDENNEGTSSIKIDNGGINIEVKE